MTRYDGGDPQTPGPAGALLASRKISLLAGSARVPPNEATEARIREAVDHHNRAARLDGQPDDLNPVMLDPARVLAFVEGLPRLPEAVLSRLAGRFVVLGAEGLSLSTASPVDPVDIARGYSLSLPEEDEMVIQATLHTAVNRDRAEALAARAEAAARAADADLSALEKAGAGTAALSNARWRRFASAKVWELAWEAIARSSPGDAAAETRLGEAKGAVAGWVAPPWVGMRR